MIQVRKLDRVAISVDELLEVQNQRDVLELLADMLELFKFYLRLVLYISDVIFRVVLLQNGFHVCQALEIQELAQLWRKCVF